MQAASATAQELENTHIKVSFVIRGGAPEGDVSSRRKWGHSVMLQCKKGVILLLVTELKFRQ